MLSITVKVRKLVEELDSAINFGKELLKKLEEAGEGNLDILKEVGVFAREAPDWEILSDERKNCIDFVREICTGEISIQKAKELTQRFISELESTRKA